MVLTRDLSRAFHQRAKIVYIAIPGLTMSVLLREGEISKEPRESNARRAHGARNYAETASRDSTTQCLSIVVATTLNIGLRPQPRNRTVRRTAAALPAILFNPRP